MTGKLIQSPIYKAPMKEPVIYKSLHRHHFVIYHDNKFNKALPLYRQEVMFNQMGLKLSRQTMANWMIKLHDEYFRTIASHMHKVLLKSQYLHGDETSVQVLKAPHQKANHKILYVGIQDRTQRGEADSCFHIRKYKRTRACPEASGGLSSYTSDGWAIRPMRNLKALHTWDAGLIVVENIRKH